MKELDLSWCQGFTNTGLLAFATYLNSTAQYNHHYRNDDSYSHYHNIDGNDDNILSSYNNKSNSITATTTTTTATSVVVIAQQQQVQCCLEKLSIEWCSQITNEAMNMISNILSLKYIHITGCCGITEEGLVCLKRNGINIC